MKKLLSFILAAAMVFTLAACGQSASFLGENVAVSIKNSNTKKMTVSCKDTYEQDVVLSYAFTGGTNQESETEEDSDKIFSVAVSNDEAHAKAYVISGRSQGTGSMTIYYKDAEETILCCVKVAVEITAKMKVVCTSCEIVSGKEYIELEPQDEDDPVIEVNDSDGGMKIIRFPNANGTWQVDTPYDTGVLNVDGPDRFNNPKYDAFNVSAVGEGDATLYFICKRALKQVIMTFNSAVDPANEGSLLLTITSYQTADWKEKTEEKEEEEKKKAEEDIPEIIVIIDDPEVVIKEINFEEADNTNDGSTCDMTFVYKGIKIDYLISQTIKYRDLLASIQGETPDEEVVMSGGGIKTTYYHFPSGYGAAVWEENNTATRITFISPDKTSADYKDALQDILDAEGI